MLDKENILPMKRPPRWQLYIFPNPFYWESWYCVTWTGQLPTCYLLAVPFPVPSTSRDLAVPAPCDMTLHKSLIITDLVFPPCRARVVYIIIRTVLWINFLIVHNIYMGYYYEIAHIYFPFLSHIVKIYGIQYYHIFLKQVNRYSWTYNGVISW